jgi:DUF4097 and DUF4098 domain-containing protein YvlB
MAPAAAFADGVTVYDDVVVNPPSGVEIQLVEVENTLGDVRVEGHDLDTIEVSAVKRAPDAETARRLTVSFTPQPKGPVAIATALQAGEESRPIPAGSISVDLVIRVPRDARPLIRVWKGQVAVVGVDKGAKVTGNQADIDFRHVSGEISSETAVGRQQFEEVVDASIDAQSLNGDVALHVARGESLRALAHSGAVVAREVRFRRISIRTIRGDIQLSGDVVAGGAYELTSYYGDVEFEVKPTARLTVRGFSRDGQVSFPENMHGRLDASSGELVASSGGKPGRSYAQLELRSWLGNVRFAAIEP